MKNIFLILITILACMTAGCSDLKYEMSEEAYPRFDAAKPKAKSVDFVAISYEIADNLIKGIPDSIDISSTKLLVVSFADINNLRSSSPLGRMLAEHIGSRLVQKGLKVADIRVMSDTLLIREGNGEFILSREAKKLGINTSASLIVAGTYAQITNDTITVSARLIRGADKVVVSAADGTICF